MQLLAVITAGKGSRRLHGGRWSAAGGCVNCCWQGEQQVALSAQSELTQISSGYQIRIREGPGPPDSRLQAYLYLS